MIFAPGLFAPGLFAPGLWGASPPSDGRHFAPGLFAPGLFAPGFWGREPGPPPVLYDGADVLDALQAWWADQAELHQLLAPYEFDDGPRACLWDVEAPEGQEAPFAVVFLASEDESEPRTTGYACLTSVLQINVHAETDAEAKAIRKAIRKAVRAAPLAVDGLPVRHVLPAGQGLQIGEGFLRGGKDSWVATLEVEVPHEVDYDS